MVLWYNKPTLKIFQSYLENRKQATEPESVTSETKTITIDIPQGSILGSKLFKLYINDLYKATSVNTFYNFADDTVIFYSGDTFETVEKTIHEKTPLIFNWLSTKQLTLDIAKTHYQIYSLNDRNPDINVLLDSQKISRSSTDKYLGVFIR